MKLLFVTLLVLMITTEKTRYFEYNGSKVNTTYDVDGKFYGTYKGRKTGFLTLNENGTGIYSYDVFGFAPVTCKKGAIQIEWGFLLKDNGSIVTFNREYGKSYPILLKSTSETKFQGCKTEILLDFIMEYKDGKLGVSSSDDWTKE
jgi:hypothetical protein